MRVAIVGGGILGLAAGRLLARERPDVEVVLLEKEASLARHQTGRKERRAGGVVWVRNAPSPAATSSLAIAEELVSRLDV